MLEGDHPSLLAEWLALAAERGLRPPPELVPELLDHAAGDASLHAAVGAAAGPLGRWLAERAPRWAFVRGAAGDADAVWADGEQAERRALLERLRRERPGRGARAAGGHVRRGDLGGPRRVRRHARPRPLGRRRAVPGGRARRQPQDRPHRRRDAARRPARARASPPGWPSAPRRCCTSRSAACAAAGSSSSCRASPTRPPSATACRRRGRRSERLRALLAATPLATWTAAAPRRRRRAAAARRRDRDALGPRRPPRGRRSRRDRPRGWAEAAIAQRDAEWARALWAVHPDSRLLTVLPQGRGRGARRRRGRARRRRAGASRAVGRRRSRRP